MIRALALLVCLALVASGCRRAQIFPAEGVVLGGRRVSRPALKRGLLAYRMYCWQCHGEEGDGRGPAAVGLDPAPRDLRRGVIKFGAVASGRLPRDEDYARVIRRGLKGTAMLGWDLPPDDLDAVVQYIKWFSPRWRTERAGPAVLPTPDPFRDRDRDGIARGAALYHGLAGCFTCHPAYETRAQIAADARALQGADVTEFRDDLHRAVLQPSDWGAASLPPDFLRHPLRSGDTLDDLYRTMAAGVGGTNMPGYRDALPEEDLWALVHYVRALAQMRDTDAADALATQLEHE